MKSAALLAVLLCAPAAAIDRVHLTAERIEAQVPGAGVAAALAVTTTLTLHDRGGSRIDIAAERVELPPSLTVHTGAITQLRLRCEGPVIREPAFECPALTASVRAARLPPLALTARVALDSARGNYTAEGSVPDVAGSLLSFTAKGTAAGMQASATLAALDLDALRRQFGHRLPFALPDDLTLAGTTNIAATVSQGAGRLDVSATLAVADVSFQNGPATLIGEKVSATVVAAADLAATPLAATVRVEAGKGQFLGGPVLLDFDNQPLSLQARGRLIEGTLHVDQFRSQQALLATATGSAQIVLQPLLIRRADVELEELVFPAAYTSYMQLLLATTPFNQLQTEGRVSGRVTVTDNLPTLANLTIERLDFRDDAQQLEVTGVNGELYWSAGATGPPRPSFLAWESSRGWGIEGARTHLDFATHDRSFQLLKPARLPFFDGALMVNTLRGENIGLEEMEGEFDAVIEPISVAPIARAMGWPEFSGRLSGRIPGLTYRDGVLALSGNVEAEVFDGRVVASNLRVREPLGAWPRLYADITARNLDLDLITRTFEFGSITGRLDVDLAGLETFNWTPTSFDLRLATPAGDRSRHRISQKAVQNLSNIGGGGGGVAAALQSGALRFFQDFGYDRLGLSCRLRNDVCQMGGVGPAASGYYIVKGSGLPRINIIGNEQRVDWPRLVSQITTALSNTDSIVVN